MVKNKTEMVNVRFTEGERQEIEEVADALEIRSSELIREAVRAKVKRVRRTHPKFQPDVEVANA